MVFLWVLGNQIFVTEYCRRKQQRPLSISIQPCSEAAAPTVTVTLAPITLVGNRTPQTPSAQTPLIHHIYIKVALHAIVGGNSQRHEFTANTNCHPTTVHYTFDKLRLHRVIHFMQSGVSILIPCPFSLCSATVGVKLSNRCTTGYSCRCYATAIPATAPTRKERSTVG